MNTKTTLEYASNSYNGGIMGRDSSAALLDMLAEVASQTLHSEKKRIKSLLASQCETKTKFVKRKSQGLCFNVPQLLAMSASQLMKQFSIFTSDELKRQYSYTCALVNGCGQRYTSFASEGRARMSIKAHLAEHLEHLKLDKHAYKSFIAQSVKSENTKVSLQHKKSKLQHSKKLPVTLNKENKDIVIEEPTNYLRKILLNDVSFTELDSQKSYEKTKGIGNLCSTVKEVDQIDGKVLGDHSYSERVKEEKAIDIGQSSVNDMLENSSMQENIVLMVVGADSVHMKEYSRVNEKVSNDVTYRNDETVYLSETPWSRDNHNKTVEVAKSAKPKGKAKFIGTSKEEREMALAFMDRIKKKGNPTGSNLQCRICDPPRSFTAPTTLVSHYRSHAGIKPYECRICRAVFTRRHSLKYHMLIHQNQTRFTCADCGKKFRHPSHFREHRRRHTGEAPFGCDDCGQRFKTRNTYKRHLKTRHGKVLTTTGELLYLSEEDFQKVRTNRKKKTDYKIIRHIMPEAISSINNEYAINGNSMSNNENWKTQSLTQTANACFDDYEIYNEPYSSKTECIETEIPVFTRCSDSSQNITEEENVDKTQLDLSHLHDVSYNTLPSLTLNQDDIENQDMLKKANMNNIQPYIKLEYTDEVAKIKNADNIIEYEDITHTEKTENETTDVTGFPGNDIKDDEYMAVISQNKEYNVQQKYITLSQHKSRKKSINFHNNIGVENKKNEQEANVLETFNACTSGNTSVSELSSNGERLEEQTPLNNYQYVSSNVIKECNVEEEGRNQTSNLTEEICLQDQILNKSNVQKKLVNAFPYQPNSKLDQNRTIIQLAQCTNFTLINQDTQMIKLVQHGKESTIFLLPNDLRNGILHIGKNNISVKKTTEETIEESK